MEKKPTSGLGVASLVTGIIAFITAFVPLMNILSFPFVLLAIVFGAVGLWQTTKGTKGGKGIAIAGLVLGVLALIITAVMYGGAAANSDSSSQQPQPASASSQAQQDGAAQQSQPQPAQAADETAPYQVEIGDARMAEDYQGNPAVVVSYTFTNNSDEAISPMAAVHAKAFQNGVQLDTAIGTGAEESGKSMNEVKPGASISFDISYELEDSTADVIVEVEELFSFSDELLAEKTFSF